MNRLHLQQRCTAVDDDPDLGTGETCELAQHDDSQLHSTRGGLVNWRGRARAAAPLKRVASR